eukprot:gene34036-65353_t
MYASLGHSLGQDRPADGTPHLYSKDTDPEVIPVSLVYHQRVRPAEERSRFSTLREGIATGGWLAGGPDYLADALEHTKPMVTFLGPYSVGKTTFINNLLGTERLHTGPEPTTDKFT